MHAAEWLLYSVSIFVSQVLYYMAFVLPCCTMTLRFNNAFPIRMRKQLRAGASPPSYIVLQLGRAVCLYNMYMYMYVWYDNRPDTNHVRIAYKARGPRARSARGRAVITSGL